MNRSPSQHPARLFTFGLSLLASGLLATPILTATEPGDPTAELRKEHELILEMVGVAERTSHDILETGHVDADRVAKLHDFFENFADQCHHAKEEEELFPRLRAENVDPPILDLLLKQHEEGRILLGAVGDRIARWKGEKGESPAADREALARYLLEYARLMSRHIDTENEYLWPKASAELDAAQLESVSQAFYRIETEELGQGFHEKYHALALELLDHGEHP